MRQLLRSPVLGAIAVTTLALATGATTAIFSIVYGVLLRPLPYRGAAEIVQLNTVREQGAATPANFSLAEFDDWSARSRTTRELAAFTSDQFTLAIAGESAEAIGGAIVSTGFFPLLGTAPHVGRYLGGEHPSLPEVVISHRLWRTRFGAAPGIVGRSVQINGRPYAIAGVADPAFRFPADDTDVWLPLAVARETAPPQWQMRGYRVFSIVGRLQPGATIDAARDEAAAVARDWQQAFPRFSKGLTATATPLETRLLGAVRPALLLLMAAVAMVLVIACTNLASLLLSRNVTRAREFAVRVALGASRADLMRLALAEAGWIAGAGAAGGLALAALLVGALPAVAPTGLPRVGDVRLDAPVLVFALAITVVITMLIGSAIGTSAWRASTAGALGDARTRMDRRTRRLQSALVCAQVALSLSLVLTASLLARSLGRLLDTPVGATNTQAITMKLTAVSRPFLDRALPAIAGIPGVRAAGITSSLPPSVSQMHTTVSTVSPASGATVEASVDIVSVSPGAFDALGIRVTAGRALNDGDLSGNQRAIVLSENAAARLFPGVDPIGRALPFGPVDPSRPPPTVVGIVTNVRYGGLDAPPDGALYLPYTARPFAMTHLVVQSGTDEPAPTIAAVRAIVRGIDPGQALSEIRPLGAVISRTAAPSRFRAAMLSGLAALALALSAMGLYAVMAHMVGTRTVEIGVRMALGATSGLVRAEVLRQGLMLTAAGLVAGAIPAYTGARLVSRFLYGVTAIDPVSIAGSIAVLIVVAAAAAWIPAARASRVPPLVALRDNAL